MTIARHQRVDGGFDGERSASLHRTHVCVALAFTTSSSRARTVAVIALKCESHEPQSRSIAIRVGSAVVSGPGVSRIGSRLKLLIEVFSKVRSAFPKWGQSELIAPGF